MQFCLIIYFVLFLPYAYSLRSLQKSENVFRSLTKLNIVNEDLGMSLFAFGASTAWIKVWTTLAKKGILDPKLSRKIIHTGSAPLFMCLWPFYSNSDDAKYIAAIVPLAQLCRLLYAGLNNKTSKNETNELVGAISRSGDQKEALGGPLIYTVALVIATAIFFKSSPIGIVAITQMAIGDGVADIFGRKFGTVKWPFSKSKSYIGTLAFITFAFTVTVGMLSLFTFTGSIDMNVMDKLPQILFISIICALIELIPVGDDNISVPIVAGIATKAWL